MSMKQGTFVISLDFELAWGIRDHKDPQDYAENLTGVHQVIPKMIQLFGRYNVHATFASVGFLFFKNKDELLQHLPHLLPSYQHSHLSPYNGYIDQLKLNDNDFHFAPHLIDLLHSSPGIEVGTHTFSHYYCMEKGQLAEQFAADLECAKSAAQSNGIELSSLVFPRNQFNNDYLEICKKSGIKSFRGNENSWLHPGDHSNNTSLFRRMFRLIDAYINISGNHCFVPVIQENGLVNIPASRFLRPYTATTKFFDGLKLRRITNAMDNAALNKKTFHLWWHPHNFGKHMEENLAFLERILQHYTTLHEKYGMTSLNMSEVVEAISKDDAK